MVIIVFVVEEFCFSVGEINQEERIEDLGIKNMQYKIQKSGFLG